MARTILPKAERPLLSSPEETSGIKTRIREERLDLTPNTWPGAPTPLLSRVALSKILEPLCDIFLSAVALLFIVFGILAQKANGRPADSVAYGTKLLSAARLGPTVFPIIFAIIVGRLMKSFAAWRVEKGIAIAKLEQLLGSRAIGSTLITLIELRSCNLLGLVLILLWAISPLGGQASLRTPSLENSLSIELSNFEYFDWATPWDAFGSLVDSENRPIWTATYLASLAASRAIKISSQDAYGNVKVPFIETIDGYDTIADGHWLPVPDSSGIEYSSLLGVQTSAQTSPANVSFNMESAYMRLACGNASMVPLQDFNPPSDWYDTGFSGGLRIATDGSNGTYDDFTRDISRPRQVWFDDRQDNGIAVTKCNLTTTYVELNISCINKVCNAKDIRPSQLNNESVTWSVLDQGNNAPVFFGEFVNASQPGGNDVPSGTESYVLEPDNPFGNYYPFQDYSKITPSLFATRYAQLLNTYYACQLAPFTITGAATIPYNHSAGISERYLSRNVDGTTSRSEQIFVCHKVWLVIQLLSSLTMTLCGVTSAMFTMLRRGPDILSSFSSLTRDNVFMAKSVPRGGSNVDGMERARYLRDVKVMLGDVAPDKSIGHIALGTVDTQKISPLRRGRFYD